MRVPFFGITISALLLTLAAVLVAATVDSGNQEDPMAVEMTKITANLMVGDIDASVAFYRDLLGFELAMRAPEEGAMDWAMLVNGGAEIMLQSQSSFSDDFPPLAERPIGASIILYIDVVNVKALYERVAGKANLLVDLHETFYGATEFAIEDPDGYVLAFAQQGGE